jgi:DNA-binding CsgD family transcriptional regulator
MGEKSITDHDIALLRDILALRRPGASASAGATATEVTFQLLERVERLVGSDWTSFGDMKIEFGRRFTRSHVQQTEQGERELLLAPQVTALDALGGSDIMVQHWWQLACSLVDRTGIPCVTSTRTTFSAREWANHPVAAHYPSVDEILLAYPAPGGRSLRVRTGRASGPPYGLRELTLMELLLPHLRPLLEATLAEHGRTDGAEHAEPQDLTLRQREILHLVALGMPNRTVGRHLGISEGTVRKHLENAYDRIGARSRTEAVFWLRAHQAAGTG